MTGLSGDGVVWVEMNGAARTVQIDTPNLNKILFRLLLPVLFMLFSPLPFYFLEYLF